MSENAIRLDFDGMKLVEAYFKMQLGIVPSRGYVVMTGDSWREPTGGVGTLTIADSNTSVAIYDLKVERVRKVQGLEGTSLVRVELKDRRWKWRYRTFTGRFNVVISNDDGEVRYDPDTVKEYTPGNPPHYVLYSFDDIARRLLEGMGETDILNIPVDFTEHIPLNKEWENADPAVALQELCEEINFGVALRAGDNKAAVVKLGAGLCPTTPDKYKINVGGGVSYNDKPDYVKVLGNRIQNEITISLEPVAIDVDGEIRKLANVAYKPNPLDPDDGTGFGKSALLTRPFSNITGGQGYTAQEAQALAEKSVFKYFRIAATGLYPDDETRDNAGLLPILKTLNTLDEQGYRKRPFPKARYYQHAPQGGFENLAEPETPKTPYRIDHRRGLVIFGRRIGTLLDPSVDILSDTKLISPPNGVRLTFAYEMKGDDDYYYLIKTDQAFPPPLSEAAILVVKRGDLTLRRVEGLNMNKSALDSVAVEIADTLLAMERYNANADILLAGAHQINLNGAIDSVEWAAKETITTHLRYGDFDPPQSPDAYEDRSVLPRMLSYTEENRRAAYLAREDNLQGARQSGDVSADEPGGIEFRLDAQNAAETTEYAGQNIGNWNHIGDNGGTGYNYPVATRIYYGQVPSPDPVQGNPAYHPSQSLDPRKPAGYVPGGVTDPTRIRLVGEMKSAPNMPTGYGVNVVCPIHFTSVWRGMSDYIEFGATIVNKTLTFFEVWRSPWDVNAGTYPHPQTLGVWGVAEFVRVKVFLDPSRTF